MTRFLLDSGPLHGFVHRLPPVWDRALAANAAGHVIGVATPIIGEFLGGIEHSDSRDRNRPVFIRALTRLVVWSYDKPAALEYARLYGDMARRGLTVQQHDLQLAAVARLLSGAVVVSSDSDLRRVPGLRVEDWTAPPANGSA